MKSRKEAERPGNQAANAGTTRKPMSRAEVWRAVAPVRRKGGGATRVSAEVAPGLPRTGSARSH